MTDLTTRAAALLAAVDKMTPGEWKAYASIVQMARAGGFDMRRCPEPKENAAGIVALHNEAPALIRELLAENERLRKPIGIDDALPWEQTLMALVDQWKSEAESLRARVAELEAEPADKMLTGPALPDAPFQMYGTIGDAGPSPFQGRTTRRDEDDDKEYNFMMSHYEGKN